MTSDDGTTPPRLTDREAIEYLMLGFIAMSRRQDALAEALRLLSEAQDQTVEIVKDILRDLPGARQPIQWLGEQ